MGLFGFGKKKEQQPASPKVEPKPEPETVPADVTPDQQFYTVNGMWLVNPNYDPSARAAVEAKDNPGVYTEDVEKFLARNDDAKLVKLTGKPDDLASYEVGCRCHVEEDIEKEKYAVTCDGDVIGYLPSSAITYAEKHETDPECLDVIIAEVEYDYDKERDIISVYIA